MIGDVEKPGFWRDQWKKFQAVPREWIGLLTLLLRPTVLFPLGAAGVALYIASMCNFSKEVNVILNIVASLASGIAAGFMVQWWYSITGNTIVIKKGRSAIRNLILIRGKAKNMAERARSKAPLEEIGNLLGLLEKDLGNSIEDWNDILPAVVLEIEALYANLDQKERENENKTKEVEDLKIELEKETTWTANEKEELKKLIASKEKEVAELRTEISELKRWTSATTTTLISGGTTQVTSPAHGYSVFSGPLSFLGGIKKHCAKCGKVYDMKALGENGLCDECNAK